MTRFGNISKDKFHFRWSKNSVIAYNLGKSFFPLMFNLLNWKLSFGLGR